ncbi:MAG: YlxR family protein [Mycobacterium sp.]
MVQRKNPAAETSTGGPVRTCIGCRKRELAVELLRVVAGSTGNGLTVVSVDASRSCPGRGAWLHPADRCLTAAIRRQAFARALRITGSPDISAVDEHVTLLAHPARETSIGRT